MLALLASVIFGKRRKRVVTYEDPGIASEFAKQLRDKLRKNGKLT